MVDLGQKKVDKRSPFFMPQTLGWRAVMSESDELRGVYRSS
ncbi:hypothetical protein C8D94_101281 [Marinirhabdus gelatinilytica]|uniref:Uncharacterized protein n=1 Tax=Marinirhabdus gelatinilytica TaxID=1703343 RepID=A0A370QK19_9FLAO|nr:hypothetical protein C8D94_101281 [Marinirhabdus gelatinilytica]